MSTKTEDVEAAIERLEAHATHKRVDYSKDDLRTLLASRAAQAEQLARAAEVVKPFAKAWAKVPDVVRGDPFTTVSPAMPKTDMIRAAAYVSDNQSKEG